MDWLLEPESWIAFLTLVILELVLAMAFSVFVELLNLRLRKMRAPVRLHEAYAQAPDAAASTARARAGAPPLIRARLHFRSTLPRIKGGGLSFLEFPSVGTAHPTALVFPSVSVPHPRTG